MIDGKKPKLQLLDNTITREFVIKGGGQWPDVTGQVRPLMPREATAFEAKLVAAKPEGRDEIHAALYAKHIREWDVTAADGSPVAVTAESLLALPMPVWSQLEDIVFGYSGARVVGN